MSKKKNKPQSPKKNGKPAAKQKVVAKKAVVSKAASKSAAKKAVKVIKSSDKKGIKKKVEKKVVKKAIVKKTKVVKKADNKKPAKKIVKPVKATKQVAPPKVVKQKNEKAVDKSLKIKQKDLLKPVKTEKEKVELKPIAKKLEAPTKKVDVAKVKPVKKGKGGRKPKPKDGEEEPEIINDELIEQLIQSTKKQKAVPKGPKIIKTFVNPMTSLTVASDVAGKKGAIPKKEPKGKFELEYIIRTSPAILYEFITTPSGLSEWFADDVNIRDGIFTFFWDGSEQKAKLLGFKDEKFIRLAWLDKPEGMYFEFRIERDELTNDTALIIVDFADEAADLETSKLLWDSQVNKLLGVLGSN